jgi:magnesium-transporting ATPase (P-type)
MTFNLNHNYQIKNHENQQVKKSQKIFDILVCLSIRLIFLIQVSFSIYFLVHFYNQYAYLNLITFVILILIESYYVIKYRNGKEYTWYSISSIFYTIVIVLLIWRLVYSKINDDENKCEHIYVDHHNRNKSNVTENFSKEKEFWLFVS